VGGPDSGLSSIDAVTGAVSSLAANARRALPEWSDDGRTMYYDRPGATSAPAEATRIARDWITGREREIGPAGMQLSSDGRKAYVLLGTGVERRIVERDLQTGTDRDLLKLVDQPAEWHVLSRGGLIVSLVDDAAAEETVLTMCALADGATKTIRLRPSRLRIGLRAPDDQSLILRLNTNEAPFWWMPLDGRSPKRLSELEGFERVPALNLHPDGRRLAIGVSYGLDPGSQLRVLENILPPARR
jgi:hypothetical protein